MLALGSRRGDSGEICPPALWDQADACLQLRPPLRSASPEPTGFLTLFPRAAAPRKPDT